MSAQNSQGIQTLLEAEKEASKIVAKAREYRTQKVKDARGEAAKEVEDLRRKKEEEFKEFEQEHSGDTSSAQTQVDKDTESTVDSIKSSFEKNKADAVKKLLDSVVEIKPELHQNYHPERQSVSG
ncbi:uncharacterized protein L969DRAFT_610370 [Mixia osmundae IAM 14324]|uniref:V-type proton ATPase subunit G n=1 Tax=Mixia osmundae (strain CBS 9802 / IAM 14324 / JCM 22182 / KY 12970) TaxID=764103 RepID=G7EB24_MIXOS|nr:uncharacterized protein L969DRAFT_610370 [Mixia osmundae IAM 14324]KEI37067.1 hypothetical protein L969DRAFT_610370 [Mixia osmundae IAM 14324]GAB00035.1 hypothetical protein E5Q_06737 [Mixia osmundae IAM 14324]